MPARAREKREKKRDDHVVIFGGPTIAGNAEARALAKPFRLRRPIRRGDVDALVDAQKKARKKPGVLVIVDGVFHDTLAVGHAEIRDALAVGWRVWGLSSMGAIRAREMMHLGMRGFGRVFERFCGDDDFQDDEVALLHEPHAPYRAVSEPLVHLRAAVEHLVAREMVSAEDGGAVIAELKSRWYGERTVQRAAHALKRCARGEAGNVARELREFDRFRWKTLDLMRFLTERPFDVTSPDRNATRANRSRR
jgi:hypothetical protein